MSLLRILLSGTVIIFVIARRLKGEPLQLRRLLVLPAVLTVIGAVDLLRSAAHPQPVDMLLLLVSAALALGLGAVRGATIEVFGRDGSPWQRYRVTTIVVWVPLIGVRIGLGVLAHSVGAHSVAGTTSLLLMLGLSLLAEAAGAGAGPALCIRLAAPHNAVDRTSPGSRRDADSCATVRGGAGPGLGSACVAGRRAGRGIDGCRSDDAISRRPRSAAGRHDQPAGRRRRA